MGKEWSLMPLVESVEWVILKHKDGREQRLLARSVTKVETRRTGESMVKNGEITYWHIIAQEVSHVGTGSQSSDGTSSAGSVAS